jgi:hypothetical protein
VLASGNLRIAAFAPPLSDALKFIPQRAFADVLSVDQAGVQHIGGLHVAPVPFVALVEMLFA